MNIEFDPKKARSNFRKHGVSFEEALTALYDPMALCIEDASAVGESRWVLVGISQSLRLLTVIYALRGETIRIISARKSTQREIKDYA